MSNPNVPMSREEGIYWDGFNSILHDYGVLEHEKCGKECWHGDTEKHFVRTLHDFIVEEVNRHADQARAEGARAGTAFAIGIIDDFHLNGSESMGSDTLYKAMKNTIRDRFQEQTGVDPAPSYPVNVDLTHYQTKENNDQ